MDLGLELSSFLNNRIISLTGSKSETNRLLLLQVLYPELDIENASESDDSSIMKAAVLSEGRVIDVHHAGTAMRFLAAFYAVRENSDIILTGSTRMKERPIKILVEALNFLGAEITYLEQEGFPPLRIKGKQILGGKISVKGDVSSQYISALMLVGGRLVNGLQIEIIGEITSAPYIKMTASLLNAVGIKTYFTGNNITVAETKSIRKATITVESDWSAASYFYSVIALLEDGAQVHLKSFRKDSLQGDSALADIYKLLGVTTTYTADGITLQKGGETVMQLNLDLRNTPDIAQTIAVTCAGLGIGCILTGLETLKIKETDRLLAIKQELQKLGVLVDMTGNSISLAQKDVLTANTVIETYNDHRMAMAFAPLAVKVPILIKDSEVVSKSYPGFWEDLKTIGFTVTPC